MTTAEIEVSLRDIFAEHFPDRTCTEDSFSDLDSVQRLTLVVALEDHFEGCLLRSRRGEWSRLTRGCGAVSAQGARGLMNAPPTGTITGALLHAAHRAAPGLGVTYVDRKEQETHASWSEVIERMRASAGQLHASGVRPGDRVVIILPTGQEFLDAFFGCQYLGAVPVPLYPPVRLGRMSAYIERTASMMERCEAVLLVTEKRIRRIMGQVLARYRPKLGTLDASTLHEGSIIEQTLWDPDVLALIQFSSGTTVHPKPVGLTHRQVLAKCPSTPRIRALFARSSSHRRVLASAVP